MFSMKRILLLADKNSLLYSTIFELLSRNEYFAVEFISDLTHKSTIDSAGEKRCLILLFEPLSITQLLPKLRTLRRDGAKLLLVLNSDNKCSINQLIKNEFDGALSIESSFQELMTAIDFLIYKNLKYLSPLLISSFHEYSEGGQFSRLSAKELDVATLLTNGKRNVEIATVLKISQKTVNTYKSRIYKKLNISCDMQLLRLSMNLKEMGLLHGRA